MLTVVSVAMVVGSLVLWKMERRSENPSTPSLIKIGFGVVLGALLLAVSIVKMF